MIESLYFGCPVFGAPYGSLPELIIKDVGFLSNQEDELVNAVLNSDIFSRQRCHEYALEEFNSKKMALAWLGKYEKVLNGENLNKKNPRLRKLQEEKFLKWE
jgi:glycosyltransferase involved in cell wall biosynthesis